MVVKINRKLFWVAVAVLLLAAGVAYVGLVSRVVPEELLPQALANTLDTPTYRYRVEVIQVRPAGPIYLSRINGEKAGGDFHLWGEMQGGPVDVYEIEGVTYLKDAITQKWIILPGRRLLSDDLFMMEVNPAENLRFAVPTTVKYLGRESLQGKKLYVLECSPQVIESKYLTKWFKDFTYRVWVEPGSKRIRRAQIHAVTVHNPDFKVEAAFEFYDQGKTIKIVPPTQSS